MNNCLTLKNKYMNEYNIKSLHRGSTKIKKVDMHIHSNFSSDGVHTPEVLFNMAKDLNMDAIIICDHDTLESIPHSLKLSKEIGIRTMGAIELSTIHKNRMVHILGYNISADKNTKIYELTQKISQSRIEISPKIKLNLEKEGFYVDMDIVNKVANNMPPVITNFANAIINDARNHKNEKIKPYLSGGFRSKNPYINFIKDYLVAGRICYVPEYIVDIYEGIDILSKSGAVPIIAHPGEWFIKDDEKDLKKMINYGLKGLEVYTPYHSIQRQEYFEKISDANNLFKTAGSDYHDEKVKPGHYLGQTYKCDMDMFEQLMRI